MGLVTIDKDKCKKDGICAEECPRQLISLENEAGYPDIALESESFCMTCGHCVAVCPHGAMSIYGAAIGDCPEVDKGLTLSWEQADQFLRSRRSIRVYKDQEVDQETIQKLIEAARYAPTAGNAQTLHWSVINGREKLKVYSETTIDWMREVIQNQPETPFATYCRPMIAGWEAGYDSILRSATGLVIPSAPRVNANGLVDLSIALSYLELAALPLGVGTCWAGLLRAAMLNKPELLESFGLPEGHTWFYPMMIGYPKFKYHRLPERKAPKITWR